MPSKINVPDKEIGDLYTSGKSMNEVGRIFGVTRGPIRESLRRSGIEIRSPTNAALVYNQQHPEKGPKHSQWYEDNPEAGKLKVERYIQFCNDNPEEVKKWGENHKIWCKEHPEEMKKAGEKRSQWCKEHPEEMEETAEKISLWRMEHPEVAKLGSEKRRKLYEDNPERLESMIEKCRNWRENYPESSESACKGYREWYDNNPEDVIEMIERSSATKQGQDYDAGEWTGFVWRNKSSRSHVLPIGKCFQLNERFKGSEGHHITGSVVIFIPRELHVHYKGHNLKTGERMDEINAVAFQYINGYYSG